MGRVRTLWRHCDGGAVVVMHHATATHSWLHCEPPAGPHPTPHTHHTHTLAPHYLAPVRLKSSCAHKQAPPPPSPINMSPRPCPLAQPVRDHFENNAEAKALLKQVKSFKVTK